jgi:hypothetical protein
MPITKLPDMVACTGAVVVTSESWRRDAILTLTLKTEEGDRYLLPLSERAVTQLTEVITVWTRNRHFLGQEQFPTPTTLQ